jgi:O-antigen/teichoic acid export membrane protein
MDWAINRMPARLRAPLRELLGGKGSRARSGRGALVAFTIRVISALVTFFSQMALARLLGSYELGVFMTVWVWVIMAGTFATLGFSVSVIRFLPAYRETGEGDLLRGFVGAGHLISLGLGALMALLGWAVITWRGDAIGAHYVVPMLLALGCIPAFALTEFQDGLGRSLGWIELALAPPHIGRPLLLLSGLMVAIAAGWPASAATAALAALFACWAVVAGQHVLQRRRLDRTVAVPARRYAIADWLKLSFPLLLLEGFGLLLLNLDVLLLNLYVSPDQIGIYSTAVRVISLVGFIGFAVTTVAMPEFARLHAAGERERIAQHWREMRRWTFIPSAAAAVAIVLLGPFLLALFGPDFPAGWPVMAVVAVGLVIRALAGPAQSLLAMSGHQNLAAAILGATVFINVVLNLLLIPHYGIMGTAVAAAISFAFEAAAASLAARRYFPG